MFKEYPSSFETAFDVFGPQAFCTFLIQLQVKDWLQVENVGVDESPQWDCGQRLVLLI